jgi:alkanesulfonate monooxygenase SsuD/methylene tetrahydromethanopterin reductase-like flavin-dependent oxidoreductase (luciferase family)
MRLTLMTEFGIQIEPQFGFSLDEVERIAEVGIANGFSTLWFSDHFMLDADAVDKVLLDPWLLMTALVTTNKEIRVGSLVFCNSYRSPSLHAKMAATLDNLADGRLEFGIGAGWKKIEYDAYGYAFPNDLTRIAQLGEAIQIMKGVWTHDKFTFKGEHYHVKDIVSFPKPVQKPHPKVWVGTTQGKGKMLELIAKYGDGINVAWTFSPSQCEEIFIRLDSLCTANGRDFAEIGKSVGLWTRCFVSEEEMDLAISEIAAKRRVSEEKYRERISSALWGTPKMMIERLKQYIDLGVSHIILMLPHGEELDQIKLIGQKVLSKM